MFHQKDDFSPYCPEHVTVFTQFSIHRHQTVCPPRSGAAQRGGPAAAPRARAAGVDLSYTNKIRQIIEIILKLII